MLSTVDDAFAKAVENYNIFYPLLFYLRKFRFEDLSAFVFYDVKKCDSDAPR